MFERYKQNKRKNKIINEAEKLREAFKSNYSGTFLLEKIFEEYELEVQIEKPSDEYCEDSFSVDESLVTIVTTNELSGGEAKLRVIRQLAKFFIDEDVTNYEMDFFAFELLVGTECFIDYLYTKTRLNKADLLCRFFYIDISSIYFLRSFMLEIANKEGVELKFNFRGIKWNL